ncbi:DRAP deaminase [Gamsiella multidivaricata]|nr:DRAP deaminase [Gamsiella multidivaricata]
MPTNQGMKVLEKDHRDAAFHIHFMKLAIEQANLSVPVPSGYCVGAVLVQETHPDPDSDLPQEDRFRVVTTGYSRELPGNTHAEEVCLIKLAALKAEEAEEERDSAVEPLGPMALKRRLSATGAASVVAHQMHKQRQGWIMYSTMEPCSTRLSGNRSCSELLIESHVRKVYVGVREPDHFVKMVVGVENMVKQGIEVTLIPGFEEQCLAPNRHVLQQKTE